MANIIIVGGGVCGVLCASELEKNTDHNITIIESQPKLLTKLEVTGNGRCNLTNLKETKEFMKYVDNGKKLYSIINDFSPQKIVEYFNNLGVELKEEKNNRIYPVSDKATTISQALIKTLTKTKVILNEKVINIEKVDNYLITTNKQKYECDILVIATGGISYPKLGSNKDNFEIYNRLGLKHTKLVPQECSINLKEPITSLMGLSLENISVNVKDGDKIVDTQYGDVLFTHFGLSGPAILNTSFALNKIHHENAYLSLNLLNKNYDQTKEFIHQTIKDKPTQTMKQVLSKQLPNRLCEYILEISNIDNTRNNANINKTQINSLVHNLSNLTFAFKSFYKPEHAFLTGGGIDLKVINTKTLESKELPNVYIGGEALDACGHLGGYNITIALACGKRIAQSIAKKMNN